MRYISLLIPLALIASPAVAQPATPSEQIRIPPEMTDPAMVEKLGNMMKAMSRAFLDLPIGEVQAAAEGRPVTDSDRALTVRELGRRDDPDFERTFERQMEQSKPIIEQSMKALAEAIPAMTKSMSEMARQLERATANMPRPDYPRR